MSAGLMSRCRFGVRARTVAVITTTLNVPSPQNNHNTIHTTQYFSFNLFNYTNIGGNLSYTRRIDAIKTDTDLVGISQVSRAGGS